MKFNKYIDNYIEAVENGSVIVSKDIKAAIELIKKKLSQKDVIIDSKKIDLAIEKIEEYFPYKLFDWQKFIIGLIHCYYSDGTLIWNQFFIMMGRGGGKNGFISALIWYLTTSFHGIEEYHIDIVANGEDQATMSFNDVYNVIDNDKKLQKAFKYNKVEIQFKKTKSKINYNTSNAKTKDSKRTGCVIFDEVHQYENYNQIKVFRSGLGKKKHCRTFYITTNGNVRGAVLDDYLNTSKEILEGKKKKSKMLPLIYRLDSKDEVNDKKNWQKANPSLKYFKDLMIEMEQEYEDMKDNREIYMEFMTKRMNIPSQDSMMEVATWDKILATNKEMPDLSGWSCIGGVDYSSVKDFTSVGLLFRDGDKFYWIHHTFICHLALQVKNREFKFPIKDMVKKGLATIIYEDCIDGKYVAEWFKEQSKKYNIVEVYADDYRKAVLNSSFKEVGIEIKKVRSGYITHSRVFPLLESLFQNEKIIWGDDPMMRWYTNNVYVETDKKGNKSFLKKEPILRKTDGFFAFIHALSEEDKIPTQTKPVFFSCYSY
ncbi:terminase TerL endonuclease subunit [Clostridium thermobutyricum]|uniref:terminase TerL endonuclease subunit n=1 Tax=Clostridium thermobutyricum TaxID=29372 RepID=UPI0018AB600D|nr:terminase TerL endonuclease subunit [Clostridium thermobutyricum]